MSREIKFRAWDPRNESMWSPEYFKLRQDENDYYIVTTTGHGAIKGVELMQFTGLKDKNGVEIFEGDVVVIRQQGAQQNPRRVLYAEEVAAFVMSHHASGKPSVGIGGYYLEVIGNIRENPELLEAKNA